MDFYDVWTEEALTKFWNNSEHITELFKQSTNAKMKLWKQVTAKCWTIYADASAACEVTTLCRLGCSVASGCALVALPSAVMFTVVSDWRSNAISVTAKLVRCGLDRRDIDVDLTGGSAGSHWSSIGTGVGSNGLLASMPPSQLTQPHSQDPHAATAAAAASPDDWRKIVDASCMNSSLQYAAIRAPCIVHARIGRGQRAARTVSTVRSVTKKIRRRNEWIREHRASPAGGGGPGEHGTA